jgi:RecJ-like exonuclease
MSTQDNTCPNCEGRGFVENVFGYERVDMIWGESTRPLTRPVPCDLCQGSGGMSAERLQDAETEARELVCDTLQQLRLKWIANLERELKQVEDTYLERTQHISNAIQAHKTDLAALTPESLESHQINREMIRLLRMK